MRHETALLLPLLSTALFAQGTETVDQEAVAILRRHGLEQSQVMDHLSWICDVHGPRLTGSPNLRRAAEWAVETFERFGLANAAIEEWGPFGSGWRLDHFDMQVVGDNPWPVLAWPKAWSPGREGRVEAEVVDVSSLSAEEVEALDLTDKIVLVEGPRELEEPFDGTARRLPVDDLWVMATGARVEGEAAARQRPARPDAGFRRQRAVLEAVWRKRPLALLDRGFKGDYGTVFVQSASVPSDPDAPRSRRPRPWQVEPDAIVPQFTLAVEHYNRIGRILAKGLPVRLAFELRTTRFEGDGMQPNVVAEIPGTDPEIGDQLVMLGAHFDSWHSATGATDNGCGSAVMIEAMRLLKVLADERGRGPRRTIRVALWSGEEQGLLGSRAYVAKHFAHRGEPGTPLEVEAAHARFSAYYNLDNGTGRIRGVYLQGNEAVLPIFRAWLAPFHDLDAATLTLSDTGGTDHLAFDAVGLPGFQFIQDPVAYSTRTHHSNMDGFDHALAGDLAQAATIIAAFAWHTAERDELLPRKPLPADRRQD